jgi:biopolymer transport protein ExbB
MESISILGIVTKGGILMIPIFICSIIVIAVAIERYLAYKKMNINIPKFLMSIRHPLYDGNVLDAINECTMARGPVAAVIKAGLEKMKHGKESIKEAMETAGNNEVYHLEKNLSILATLAGITPLIGFLGTVIGMIKAFMKIQQLSGNVNADVLAGGIWEAMVTTAAGLSVGIPAMILYNYYVHRVREFTFHMESSADEVFEMIATAQEKGKSTTPVKEQEPVPHIPSPNKSDPYDSQSEIKLASETFDPEDKNFDGGIPS